MPQAVFEAAGVALKSLVAAVVLFALARLMGKKQIAQLSFFDYVVGISIGSIAAAMSVERNIFVADGIVSMVVWALFPITFSFISLHSMGLRRLLDGTPTVLVQGGKIIEKNLCKTKFTVNDLLEELRMKDVFNIADVDTVILETSGKLSVLKKPSPPTDAQGGVICANVIIDGKWMLENMKQIHVDEQWLAEELRKNNICSVSDVLLATCDVNCVLHIDRKNADPDDIAVFQ